MHMELIHRIRENKKDGKEPCRSCPLREDMLAWFECADARPQVVVVSESPVDTRIGKEKEKGNSILDNGDVECWARYILLQCKNQRDLDPSRARNMGQFLGRLTEGRIYNEAHETRTHGLYWTHTVKCFLQNEKYKGIGEAKKNRGFRQAVRACRNYLSQEIESIQPKLVVAVGKEAAVALERLKYEGQLKYAGQLVRVDHPAWGRFGKQANKRGRLLELCRKVKALEEEGRLIDVLPGCRFIEDP